MAFSSKIIRNFIVLASGEVIGKIATFLAFAYLARVLGAQGFGVLGFGMAVVSYFRLIVDFGFDTYGAREVAKAPDAAVTYVNNIVAARLLLSVVAYGLLALFVWVTPKSLEVKQVMLLYGLSLFTLALTLKWVFQGIERMSIISLGTVLNQLVFLIGCLVFVKSRAQIFEVPLLKVVADVALMGILYGVYRTTFRSVRITNDRLQWKSTFAESLPIGLALVFGTITLSFDVVIIGFAKGEAEVGWYIAAYNIVLLFITLGLSYYTAIFPTLSRYYQSPHKISDFLLGSLKLTSIMTIPIAIMGTGLAKAIIQFIYGPQYQNSVLPFQLLIWSVPIVLIRGNYKHTLLALSRQKIVMQVGGYGAAANVALNFILIPLFGLVGAAIATLCAATLTFVMFYYYVNRDICHLPLKDSLAKPMVAAMVMAIYLFLIRDAHLFVSIITSLGVYFLSLIAMKGLSVSDLGFLYSEQFLSAVTRTAGNPDKAALRS